MIVRKDGKGLPAKSNQKMPETVVGRRVLVDGVIFSPPVQQRRRSASPAKRPLGDVTNNVSNNIDVKKHTPTKQRAANDAVWDAWEQSADTPLREYEIERATDEAWDAWEPAVPMSPTVPVREVRPVRAVFSAIGLLASYLLIVAAATGVAMHAADAGPPTVDAFAPFVDSFLPAPPVALLVGGIGPVCPAPLAEAAPKLTWLQAVHEANLFMPE